MLDRLGEILGPPWAALPIARTGLTLAMWAAVGLLLELLRLAVRRVGRRSQSQIEEVLSTDLRAPLWALVGSLALGDVVRPWIEDGGSLSATVAGHLSSAARAGAALALVWLAYRVVRDLIRHVAVRVTAASETMIDDMLLPIARTLLLPAAMGLGAVLVLEAAGMPVQSIALLVGGASFVLAFAFQRTLEDVFGGISLLVDTPFSYGDVLHLSDGTIAEVVSLGLRVTRLYDASTHAVIIMPNRMLVGQKLVNLSRPTPDLRMTVSVAVPGDVSARDVEERLLEAALGHPYLLGPATKKLAAMRSRMERMVLRGDTSAAAQMIRDMVRVQAEADVNAALVDLSRHLLRFSGAVHAMEEGAYSPDEQAYIEGGMGDVRGLARNVQQRVSAWMLCVRYTYVTGLRPPASESWQEDLRRETERLTVEDTVASSEVRSAARTLVDTYYRPYFDRAAEYVALVDRLVAQAASGSTNGPTVCLLGRERTLDGYFAFLGQEQCFAESGFASGLGEPVGLGIVDLDDVDEYLALVREWDRKTALLLRRIRDIENEFARGSGVLLDEKLYALRCWIETDYKDGLPRWKRPSVSIVDVADSLTFELKAYVDNVKLSHYTRASKAQKQVRGDIVELFRSLEPPVPLAVQSMNVTVSAGDEGAGVVRSVARIG